MRVTCGGCDWTAEAETSGELHDAIMEHAEDAHADQFEGKSESQTEAAKRMLSEHVDRQIIDQN